MKSNNAPGPRGTPIGGSLWAFWKDVFKLFERGNQNYGDVVRYRVIKDIYHLIVHPDDLTYIMFDNKSNYSRRITHSSRVLHSVTGDSTLTLEGPEWHIRRRLAAPAFSPKSLSSYTTAMLDSADQLADLWDQNTSKDIEVQPAMSSLTAAIAGHTFFGADAPWQEQELEKSMDAILDHHWQRIKSRTDLIHKLPFSSRRRFDQGINYINTIVDSIIEKRESMGTNSLLARLINAKEDGHTLGEQGVHNEIVTFLLAGHETTATALLWAFYELAQHPEWQESIAAEANEHLNGEIDISIVKKMSATRRFFLEVLRLHPPVWLIERQALEDDTVHGYHIPKGSSVLMSSLTTHRHPDFWEKPDSFLPERFTTDKNDIHKNAFYPFGLGQHTCIGQNFAMLEAVIIIGRLMQRFNVKAADKDFVPEYQVGITLRMKKPFWVKLASK